MRRRNRRRKNPGLNMMLIAAAVVGYMLWKKSKASASPKIVKPGDAGFVGPLPQ